MSRCTLRGSIAALSGLLALLLACDTAMAQPSVEQDADVGNSLNATKAPRLLVLMVIDGLPMRQLEALRPELVADGFRRFLQQGRWYGQAHHGHGHTVTAAGETTSDTAADPLRLAMARSWHAGRSPPLLLVPQAGWILGARPRGSQHGSPHPSDSHVPLLLWGPTWMDSAELRAPVPLVDLALTLATVMGLPAPAQSQGQALSLRERGRP